MGILKFPRQVRGQLDGLDLEVQTDEGENEAFQVLQSSNHMNRINNKRRNLKWRIAFIRTSADF